MSARENAPVRGTYDLLPGPARKTRRFLESAFALLEGAGFEEIETPIIEEASLFNRTSGSASDIVSKEMYRVSYGGAEEKPENLVLRPEGTAPLVRAYLSSFHYRNPAGRFYYWGPMFRYNRPQRGRFRQFLQLGVEIFDADGPHIDAECLFLLAGLMEKTGLPWPALQVNTLGCRACQDAFRPLLAGFLAGREDALCGDCRRRSGKNPLRVMDCPRPGCREAVANGPRIEQNLCAECREHFDQVLRLARRMGVDLEVDTRLVRGLDYYTRTVFEVLEPGGRNAVAAGGRYDRLVADLGGKPTPALGFALGLERFLERLEDPEPGRRGVRIAFLDEPGESRALEAALEMMLELRKRTAHPVTVSPRRAGKLRSQLSGADRDGCRFVLIVGTREIETGRVVVRDLESGVQETVEFQSVARILDRPAVPGSAGEG